MNPTHSSALHGCVFLCFSSLYHTVCSRKYQLYFTARLEFQCLHFWSSACCSELLFTDLRKTCWDIPSMKMNMSTSNSVGRYSKRKTFSSMSSGSKWSEKRSSITGNSLLGGSRYFFYGRGCLITMQAIVELLR